MQAHEDPNSVRRDLKHRLHLVPASTNPLFGRDADLAAIGRLLIDERVRLLSLTGPGGTGKTRLACAAAAATVEAETHQVYFVDLSAVEDPAVVPASVAQALGIQDSGSGPLQQGIADQLGGGPALLVLDNFEQVLGATGLVSDLLERCPDLLVLVTTREPLHLKAEHVYAVAPLPVPAPDLSDPLAAAANPSLALFLDRARAIQESFVLTDVNLPAMVEICTCLEGIPLAIELAAAQVRVLSPRAILDRLRSRTPLPLAGPRDAPARHRTLHAAVASSYDLLSTLEQSVFRWCSVFPGGFTAPAAAAVCALVPSSMDILRLLAQLADKSLIVAGEEPNGEPRFRWLETIRADALDRLVEHDEVAEARQRHAVHCLALAEQADSALIGRGMGDTFDLLEREYDNFRAAFHWSLEGGDLGLGLALAGTLYRFWMLRGHLSEARQWLDRALPRSSGQPAALRARALNAAGVLAGLQDDNPAAEQFFSDSVALWRELGDQPRMAAAVGNLGLVAQDRHDVERALACFQESQALYEAVGDQRGIAITIGCRARLARQQGDHAAARALFEQSVGLFRALGEDLYLANSLANIGHTDVALGDLERAATAFRESLEIRQALGHTVYLAECLEGFAALAGAARQLRRAARLYGAADALREVTGHPVSTTDRAEHEALLGRIRGRLGESNFLNEWAVGRALDLDAATRLAMDAAVAEDPAQDLGQEGGLKILTRREREVAAHVAGGLTNREIAAALMVAERTVETHLEHIFDKLGAQTRSEVAVWVTRQGLEPVQPSSTVASRESGRLGTRR